MKIINSIIGTSWSLLLLLFLSYEVPLLANESNITALQLHVMNSSLLLFTECIITKQDLIENANT